MKEKYFGRDVNGYLEEVNLKKLCLSYQLQLSLMCHFRKILGNLKQINCYFTFKKQLQEKQSHLKLVFK